MASLAIPLPTKCRVHPVLRPFRQIPQQGSRDRSCSRCTPYPHSVCLLVTIVAGLRVPNRGRRLVGRCAFRIGSEAEEEEAEDESQIYDDEADIYVEPVFRPPAEGNSIILQVTNGCSWNRCSFCEMYTAEQKAFRAKSANDIKSDLKLLSELWRLEGPTVPPRVFLADGDAMTLPVSRLRDILLQVKAAFPDVSRVASYCLPRNLQGKSVEELASLRELGLRTLYVGCESGDDEVLRRVGKGETSKSSLAALRKIKEAGLKSSVMILNGLGGRQLSRQHAENSAALMNAAQPNFLSTLVVSFPLGLVRHAQGFSDLAPPADGEGGPGFQALSPDEVLEEMRILLDGLELQRTIFRSDHASNYLSLQGVLGRDKARLLGEIEDAQAGLVELRPEWARGL